MYSIKLNPRNFKFLEDYGVSKITDFIVDSGQPCSELAAGSLAIPLESPLENSVNDPISSDLVVFLFLLAAIAADAVQHQ